ncbi:MAG: hypothetical protein Q9228_001435 [Teloschistes exilis]
MDHFNPGQTDPDPEDPPPDQQVNAEAFRNFVMTDPQAAFADWQQLQRQYEAYQYNATPASSAQPALMGQYRKDGLCTLTTLFDWRQKLRHLCGNPFEEEDARTYLRATLKQGPMPFHKYIHLFFQKKERSRMDDTALLDCLKRNVNYSVQEKAFTWRTKQGNRPVTFDEHVEAYNEIDSLLSQLKHRQPRSTTHASTLNPL